MPRPVKCRRVTGRPGAAYFKPHGIPMKELDEVVLAIDEFEAVRLADLEGLYQEDAARRMGISRQTFGNIVASARRKIAGALAGGKALRIEGIAGPVKKERRFGCVRCAATWTAPCGTGRPHACPSCSSADIYRITEADNDGKRGR